MSRGSWVIHRHRGEHCSALLRLLGGRLGGNEVSGAVLAGEAESEVPVAAGAGDRRASFVEFYDATADRLVRALAVTLGDQELARDATQEAMARAWRSWEQVQGYGNPSGWVYRVGLNWGRSRLRRLSREVLGRVRDRTITQPEVFDPVAWDALMDLPVTHRAVVVLRLLLDWSVAEVAESLGIPQGTVRSRQHHALEQLRERLEVDR